MVKGAPLRPERCCLKKTGPREVNLIATAASKNNGEVINKKMIAPKKSMHYLTAPCHETSGAVLKMSSGRPINSSNVVLEIRVVKKSAMSQTSTPSSSQALMMFSICSK